MIRNFLAAVLAATLSLAAFSAFATDVNRASQAELEALKGIGPALSGKILKARETGPFQNWNDFVLRVGGVGPASAAKLSQAGMTVSGAAFDPAGLPAPAKREPKATKPKADKAAGPAAKS